MRRDGRGSRRRVAALATLLLAVALAAPASASADITARGAAARATYASDSTTSVTLSAPSGAQPGDVLVATLGVGSSGASSQPAITPPAGWTLATRTNQGAVATLAVFTHPYAAGETAYTWTTSAPVGGIAFVAAFAGVDNASPVDVSAGRAITQKSHAIATPSVTTTGPNEMLVAGYYGYRSSSKVTTWKPPSGMTELGDAANSTGSRSGSVDSALQSAAGASGTKTATPSADQDYSIAALTALRPAGAAPIGPPVISAVQVGATTTSSATITWTTDQPADSQVEYGTTSAYGTSAPIDTTMVTAHSQVLTGLEANTVYHYRVNSRNASGQLTTSGDFSFQTTANGAAVPLIVDTDIFSDADDVGALATAFGLQLQGKANVIAVGVNTRTSRPAVATNSWKCVAAVTSFYQAPAIPIGTALPNNGTAVNSPDFVGPCSKLAPAIPTPDSAVNVYRRALAAQPDGSVVMASVGYFGNLSALLNSPADSISPLTGRDLIARKVKTLVAMAGGYPQRSGENNLIGDPASAQNVAANWPTKIVWDGYEVGDAVHTGSTIPSTHPADSPVRVAYEAFVKPGNWIYSYDLTAVYHALLPDDSLLTEVGPGTNVIDSSGGNVFTKGSGNQYYLTLSSATALDSAIDGLIDTVPSAPPSDTTPPAISGVSAGSVTSSGATVSWTTDEAATTQVEYGTTTAYGSATTLDGSLAVSHSQALSGLAAGTLYHYRVKSKDAAGNLAVSGDYTLTTAAAAPSAGPADTFDQNVIDPAKWIVTTSGSTVAAANQELEITHPASSAWTKGLVTSASPHDQTGKALQVQMKRAANGGQGGVTYGETSLFLMRDSSHYVQFWVAGGSLTAWINSGSGEVNLTPNWPSYSSTNMQWLRFRESGGTLYFEYASGATSPGPWNVLTSTPDPIAMGAVQLQIVAGSNVTTTDTAKFDNVATY